LAAQILGLEYYLPDHVISNEQLKQENPEWRIDEIYEKTGIRTRHIARADETAADLALGACRKLLDRQFAPLDQIDFLLYCSQSPDYYLPSVACILQDQLALSNQTGALDFNLGCSGYVYGLELARLLIEAGQARNVLLVTSDTYSKYVHPKDRTVRTLFGDGAAATLIGSAPEGPGSILPALLGTDGKGYRNLIVPAGALRTPNSVETAVEQTDTAGCIRTAENLFMDGRGIFTFALTRVPKLIKDTLARHQLSSEDIDWYVYHQANKFMLEQLAERSKVPTEKMVMAFQDVGNTVSSSIPIALKMYLDQGRIQAGQRLLMVGFGVGYSWGGNVVVWRS
jgi:3-oxoacyl-[acyl-carrier-protein] synthase III